MKWLSAITGAVLFNGVLFLLLPTLILSTTKQFDVLEVIPAVNVIRIKRTELPPKRKKIVPPPQPEKQEPEKKPLPLKKKVALPKLRLPFRLSPAMPTAPNSLELPPMEVGSFTPLGRIDGVEAGQLDKALMPTSRISPVYPLRAKRRGIEGWVKVRFLVDEQGYVSRVEIVEAEPTKVFDKSVRSCVSKWRFHPGTIEGMPVKAWAETTIKFKLN